MSGAMIPWNWASFLRVNENKTELFSFLSGILQESFQLADKELVITKGDDVLSKPPLLDTSALAPCNHKEANSHIMLHAAHDAHNGHKKCSSTHLTLMLLSWQWSGTHAEGGK